MGIHVFRVPNSVAGYRIGLPGDRVTLDPHHFLKARAPMTDYAVKIAGWRPQVIDKNTNQPVHDASVTQITFSSAPIIWGPNGPQNDLGTPTATIQLNGQTITGVPVQ